MKKSHIILLLVLAIATAIILTTIEDASTYVTFDGAEQLSKNGSEDHVHVVGELKKDAQGNITNMEYNPTAQPITFIFTLVDDNGREERVTYYEPKPTDIDKSEKVVVVGRYKGDQFIAKNILLKCPSKYENKEITEAGL